MGAMWDAHGGDRTNAWGDGGCDVKSGGIHIEVLGMHTAVMLGCDRGIT